jgi:EAL domain-containing protein (putative c-di-GMP-specific phosphodiesterase class I)
MRLLEMESHLHQFPINTIKVDRTFINEIGTKGENIEIVQTIVNLAHNLGMDVIAEGMETQAHMEYP